MISSKRWVKKIQNKRTLRERPVAGYARQRTCSRSDLLQMFANAADPATGRLQFFICLVLEKLIIPFCGNNFVKKCFHESLGWTKKDFIICIEKKRAAHLMKYKKAHFCFSAFIFPALFFSCIVAEMSFLLPAKYKESFLSHFVF